jgi:hypothetical protein
MAWHRWSGGKQRWGSNDGFPEEGSGGGVDKMHGEGPFYSCVSRRGNADLHKEGGDGSAQRGGRASMCSRGSECSEAAMGAVKGTRGGGNFVRTPASGW